MLFGLIAASVSPDEVADVLAGAPALVALMVLVIRPAMVALTTWGSELDLHRDAAQAAGLDARRGGMLVDSLSREAELEEVTDALLLSRSDDFNALAAADLRSELGHGHVYRIAPDPDESDLLPPASDAGILGRDDLTFAELSRRLADGAQIVEATVDGNGGAGGGPNDVPLFVVRPNGGLHAVTDVESPTPRRGDTVIALADATSDAAAGRPTSPTRKSPSDRPIPRAG